MSVRVYKIGGPALEDPGLVAPLAEEVRRGEGRAVLVHGGGRAVDRLLKALQIESRFVDGRRETSPEAMAVVEMVLSGSANKQLAAGLTAAGVPRDRDLRPRRRPDARAARARPRPGGTPQRVDPAPIRALWDAGFLPVVSPVSNGPLGEARQRERRRGRARHRAARWALDARLPLRRGRRADRRARRGRPHGRGGAAADRRRHDRGRHGAQGARGARRRGRGDPRGRDRGQGQAAGAVPRAHASRLAAGRAR